MTWRHLILSVALLTVLGCAPRVRPLPDGKPRFAAADDGTVRDQQTQLAWVRDVRALQAGAPFDGYTWPEALAAVADMNAGRRANLGFTDWRLPRVAELAMLRGAFVVPGTVLWCWSEIGRAACVRKVDVAPFVGIEDGAYWSGTNGVLDGDRVAPGDFAPSADDAHSADVTPVAWAVDAWARAVSLPKTERRRLIVVRNP